MQHDPISGALADPLSPPRRLLHDSVPSRHDDAGRVEDIARGRRLGLRDGDQAEVAARMEAVAAETRVDAILTTGDNFYRDDTAALLGPYQWAFDSGIDFWITWGNHDIESSSRIAAVNAAFGDPPRWTTNTWGGTELIILDSNDVDSEEQSFWRRRWTVSWRRRSSVPSSCL